jgi:hypothetical protein
MNLNTIFLPSKVKPIGKCVVRAVLSMWSWIVQLDEENPTYAGLAQEIGFGFA